MWCLERWDRMKPSKDFKLDYKSMTVHGNVTDLDEIRQNEKLALATPRLMYLIYSADYGSEIQDLIGKDYDYVLGRIRTAITECLMVDDRITSVDNFEITKNGEYLDVSFTIHTLFGDIDEKERLSVNGF